MLARYIVIIIYGLDKFLEKTSFFLFFNKKNNNGYNYFKSDSEAFECCNELNEKNLHCHIIIEAKAKYNTNINPSYIKKNDNIIIVIS